MGAPDDTPNDAPRRVSTTRVVLITLACVLGVAALVAAGIGGYLAYRHQASIAKSRGREVHRLDAALSAAKEDSATQYIAGYTKGRQVERTEYGPLAGFDWQDGGWYVVRVKKANGSFSVSNQSSLENCKLTFIENDQVWIRPNDNPC